MYFSSALSDWRKRLLMIAVAGGLLCLSVEAVAQDTIATVTMNTGLQYEGRMFGTESIATGKTAYEAHGTRNIVMIADGLRQIFVGRRRVFNHSASNQMSLEIPIFQRSYQGQELAPSVIRIGPFNENGHREFIVQGSDGPLIFTQGISNLTPTYCEIKTLVDPDPKKQFQSTMRIGTETVPTPVLQSLLRKEIRNPENPSEFLRVADFLIQAKRFDAAQEELWFIQSKFPQLDERLERAFDDIRQNYARQVLREIRMRLDAGQFNSAMGLARVFEKDNLAATILAEFAELEEKAEETTKELESVKEKVNQCIRQAQNLNAEQTEAVRRLKNELETELNDVNMPRLDSFLRLANDETIPAQQKLALIISGWVLGSNHAFENLAIAQELFEVRDLVRKYLTTDQAASRDPILEQLRKFESGTPQRVAAMAQQMGPVDPHDLTDYNGSKPIEWTVRANRPAVERDQPPYEFRCLVHLPTEYDPYRRYPLLISLPPMVHTAEQNLEMWCGTFSPRLNQRIGHAERNGYITMVVDWRRPHQRSYGCSSIEHQTVLKALRQAMRKFSVDSDRVYLAGQGEGGEAAYDIGLAHPEHWAGIIGVSAKIEKYANKYRGNEHWPLPVYSVAGSNDVLTNRANQDTWSEWVANVRYVDATVVWYVGRPAEFFDHEEIPETFKWMNAQRRRWPDRAGFELKCRMLRPWDNYFWFLEVDPTPIPFDRFVWPEAWTETVPKSGVLTVEATLKEGNLFRVGRATKPFTLWLSPDFVDFSQDVSVSGQSANFKRKVEPSLSVLLEDIRKRADRDHPYWAKLSLTLNEWTVN